jgi:hypothetical protein
MVAVELVTGQRAWELNIAGHLTPWVAGEWVFVVTGSRAAARRVPRFRQGALDDAAPALPTPANERSGPVFWRGPVLAGGNWCWQLDGQIAS